MVGRDGLGNLASVHRPWTLRLPLAGWGRTGAHRSHPCPQGPHHFQEVPNSRAPIPAEEHGMGS